MVAMKPYVKLWYEALADGKLAALRCKRCGAYVFPYLPVCPKCSSTDLEPAELSGDAYISSFTYTSIMPFNPQPCISCMITFKEGPKFMSWLDEPSVTPDDFELLMQKLPVPVTTEIRLVDPEENLYYPVFHLKEPLRKEGTVKEEQKQPKGQESSVATTIRDAVAKIYNKDISEITDETRFREDLYTKSPQIFALISVVEDLTGADNITYADITQKHPSVGEVIAYAESLMA
jgi:uncharacterized OB-fold protein/acyl carrier protein